MGDLRVQRLRVEPHTAEPAPRTKRKPMIAACPECAARYRIDDAKVPARGARIRCAKCSEIFRVAAPDEPSSAAPAGPEAGPAPGAGAPDRDRLVVVALKDAGAAAATDSALRAWGLETETVRQGGDAMLALERARPRAVVLDAELPGMRGRQICEVVKRNDSLRAIKVILVEDIGEVGPGEEFGPDARRTRTDLSAALLPLMRKFGLPVEPEGAQAPAFGEEQGEAVRIPAADGLDDERAKAERLARIVVSDIVLYQGPEFERANRAGTLLEDFCSDLAEGRQLLAERVDERVCKERDHVQEELVRVAEARRDA